MRRNERAAQAIEREIESAAFELIDDCEAFLAGQMAERLEERDALIPAWAWLNLLAHGDVLALWAERDPGTRAANRQWREARGYMAMEVLELANLCGSLDTVQSAVLQPLELEAMSRSDEEVWTTRDWFGFVGTALCAFRAMIYRPGGPMAERGFEEEEAA